MSTYDQLDKKSKDEVKQLREQGLKQKEIALRLGISQSLVSKLLKEYLPAIFAESKTPFERYLNTQNFVLFMIRFSLTGLSAKRRKEHMYTKIESIARLQFPQLFKS
ncbi:hypothetical protein BVG16_08135 [Paenibacillus selenitireducens]|uniref:HTH cro/C1-type domain-containing protein n=1 Tax=Paenibacillus selenitireducens TaxID=1324314 RepID=A0A1T2XHC5_9BACL|nr:hypothetical protein BVG16_08135 [Paenibacillus selenitireducens]